MLTRRGFAVRFGLAAAASRMLPEIAYAQRALVTGALPADMVWLNANENPDGPPQSSIDAMAKALPFSGRYHFQEYGGFCRTVARSEDLSPDQILVGAGSTEILHDAVDAFTSQERPLITLDPTFEGPIQVARGHGRPVVLVPLTSAWGADVKALAAAADKSGGGLIYLCNPNNPTSSVTPKSDLAWLAANLPSNTVLLLDEAYIHFTETPEMQSGLPWVREGKSVVVARTFSKIYGMAGLRAGFGCAPPALIERMSPFHNSVISYVTVQAVLAALAESPALLPERKARLVRTRRELCGWLRDRNVPFIDPQGNFLMVDVGRDAREFITAMPRKGVAVGRPFPPLTNMLRVTIGTGQEMARFREVFWSVYKA